MEIVVYSQYYRTRTADRQLEIDECLRRNLNHPGISRIVLFCESDAPPVPSGTVPVEVIKSDERITYAEWFRWLRRQTTGIGLLLNADIYLDEGLAHLSSTFDQPEVFLALTRYNPGQAGFHLNDFPHWTQDVWGLRADAELPESLLYASSFPLGFPGCDNRIAYVLWSHGFHVRNPCYHVRSVHLQASKARAYNKTNDRLYGGVTYVHPSLAPDEDSELEFTLWTRSRQRPPGVLINQQAIEQGVHQLRHGEAEVAQRFLDQQQFTGLSWMHEAMGSAHLQGDVHPFLSEDTVFLPLPALLQRGVELQLPRPTRLEGLMFRLPRRAEAGYQLELVAKGEGEAPLKLQGERALALKSGGERLFWQPPELKGGAWQQLQVKLIGPANEPPWRSEEGAELVLFGQEGALAEIKSLQLIAEETPARLLRMLCFADAVEIDLKGLEVQPQIMERLDGKPAGDGLIGSSNVNTLKYAFNTYNTSETGAYTASLEIKPGTQSRIVLRINDQSGNNDVRQIFDLARGRKEGEAVIGGSATDARSKIESLGGGWYRCSISGTFHEPLTCLHAPSLWFEHYAPSTTTGILYTGEARILKGLDSGHVDKPCEELPAIKPDEEPEPRKNDPPLYCWYRRRDYEEELAVAEELHRFGQRFRVLRSGDKLLFDDRFWPSLGVSPIEALPCGLDDAQAMLLWGFGQPAVELRPSFIAHTKRFSDDVNFWQYPCRTEGDAFAVHQSLVGPQLKDGVLQLYLGLPWATWIDRESWPTSTLKGMADRLQKLRAELQCFGIGLRVHSVCQHILWRENLHLIKTAGVECLWLSHKPQEEEELEGVELRAWHLYPVNAREPDRRDTLVIKPMAQRPWLASFIGAHMEHYITDVRLRLQAFKDLHRFHIQLQDEWHFNPIVYGEQVGDLYVIERKGTKVVQDDTHRYNKILSGSQFSLCPAGAGPNSLRLWESLAVGSVPVILSDQLAMPDLKQLSRGRFQNWDEILLFHPEAELDSLPERLEAMPLEELQQRSDRAVALMALVNNHTCLGVAAQRDWPELKRQSEPDPSKPTIVLPVYGPTDRWFWRAKKHGFYNMVIEWYFRDYVDISFGEKGFFWWREKGRVLLMDRDNVSDLFDRKVDPPRWEGEVDYDLAFFFNQYHVDGPKNKKCTYFTYDPIATEKARASLGRVPYVNREINSFFAGSIENEVQEYYRNKFAEWIECVEVSACSDRLYAKEPHKFSQSEYIEMISKSKFGVCFRGNGPKCFREIEYLAMGTPLIITPGVEVDYPDPLIEGVHYLRATTEIDIQNIPIQITPVAWERMSIACYEWFSRNASCEKVFEYLKAEINSVPARREKHTTLRILSDKESARESPAAISLKIFDPKANWISSEDDRPLHYVEAAPDDLIICQLPWIDRDRDLRWKVTKEDRENYINTIYNSQLDAHKSLLESLGLKVRGFSVGIINSATLQEIPILKRFNYSKKRITVHAGETAVLSSEYDNNRNIKETYKDRTIRIHGPATIEEIKISSTLYFDKDNRSYKSDVSRKFKDYYTMYGKVIPEELVFRICKLWEYEHCIIKLISGTIIDPIMNYSCSFNYENPVYR
jgi:hypothetical protein